MPCASAFLVEKRIFHFAERILTFAERISAFVERILTFVERIPSNQQKNPPGWRVFVCLVDDAEFFSDSCVDFDCIVEHFF